MFVAGIVFVVEKSIATGSVVKQSIATGSVVEKSIGTCSLTELSTELVNIPSIPNLHNAMWP